MRFTDLLPHIVATYPEQNRAFHVLATRFYVGADRIEDLRYQAAARRPVTSRFDLLPTLSPEQVETIIRNR